MLGEYPPVDGKRSQPGKHAWRALGEWPAAVPAVFRVTAWLKRQARQEAVEGELKTSSLADQGQPRKA